MSRLENTLRRVDRLIAVATDEICNLLLLMMTLVVLFSVVMRYVFGEPLFWSDVVSMFGNVGVILLGQGLIVRDRELIAMQALYAKISPRLALALDATWNVLVLLFAVVFTWYGLQAALALPGFYWELGMLPQKYPMMIIPIAGALLIAACARVLVQDVGRWRALRSQKATVAK